MFNHLITLCVLFFLLLFAPVLGQVADIAPDPDWNGTVSPPSGPPADLTITSNGSDFEVGETVCLWVDLSNVPTSVEDPQPASGDQLVLRYDATALRFEGAAPGDHTDSHAGADAAGCPGNGTSVFVLEIFQEGIPLHRIVESGDGEAVGEITYVVGTGFLGPHCYDAARVATLQFTALAAGPPDAWFHGMPNAVQPPITNRVTKLGGDILLPLSMHDLPSNGTVSFSLKLR